MEPGDAQAIIQAAKQFGDAEVFKVGDVALVSLPSGRTINSIKKLLDEYADAPDRKRGTATLTTEASFVDHVNRHKDADSVVFADVADTAAPKLIAVYDYNVAGSTGGPRFGQHRAVYPFPVSDEWRAWLAISKRGPMPQAEFAEFLEARIMDIAGKHGARSEKLAAELGYVLASPQKLLELSRGLTVHAATRVANHQNLSTGEGQILFQSEHRDEQGAPIKVPGAFTIGIPVLRGGQAFSLPVRLRYRVKDGGVTWSLSVENVDRTWAEVIDGTCATVREKTALPLFYGTPEV